MWCLHHHYLLLLFTITSIGTLPLSLADIESPAFDFCHLSIHLGQDSASAFEWTKTAISVLSNIPIWLFGDSAHLVRNLSELSSTELHHTVHAIMPSKSFNHTCKSAYVHHILQYFMVQCTHLLDSDLTHIASDVCHECSLTSKFFQDWYRQRFGSGFLVKFTMCATFCVPWIGASFYNMDLALLRLPKKIILTCLHKVHSYIKPARALSGSQIGW